MKNTVKTFPKRKEKHSGDGYKQGYSRRYEEGYNEGLIVGYEEGIEVNCKEIVEKLEKLILGKKIA